MCVFLSLSFNVTFTTSASSFTCYAVMILYTVQLQLRILQKLFRQLAFIEIEVRNADMANLSLLCETF